MRSICTRNCFRSSARATGSCSQCSLIRTHFFFAGKSAAQWFVSPRRQSLTSLPAAARPDFLSYKKSARPEPRLQFAQISFQQLLQLARPHYHNGIAFDPQEFSVTKLASVRDNVSLAVLCCGLSKQCPLIRNKRRALEVPVEQNVAPQATSQTSHHNHETTKTTCSGLDAAVDT